MLTASAVIMLGTSSRTIWWCAIADFVLSAPRVIAGSNWAEWMSWAWLALIGTS